MSSVSLVTDQKVANEIGVQVVNSRLATISALPEETLLKVFSFFDVYDLCRSSKINKRWSRLSKDWTLWAVMRRHFPTLFFYAKTIDRKTINEKATFVAQVNLFIKRLPKSLVKGTKEPFALVQEMMRFREENERFAGSSFEIRHLTKKFYSTLFQSTVTVEEDLPQKEVVAKLESMQIFSKQAFHQLTLFLERQREGVLIFQHRKNEVAEKAAEGLARSLNRPFFALQTSDFYLPEQFSGKHFYYVDGHYSIFTEALIATASHKPVIYLQNILSCWSKTRYFDEVLQLISFATNPEINHNFRDSFLPEQRIDLSNVLFVMCQEWDPEGKASSYFHHSSIVGERVVLE